MDALVACRDPPVPPPGLGLFIIVMIAMRSPLGTPGRSKSRTMNPVAKENIPMCVIPIGTTRCSLPRTGVAAASANGYGATSCHPFAASFASYSVARRFVRRAAAAPAASGPLPRGGTNGFGRSIRGTVGFIVSRE